MGPTPLYMMHEIITTIAEGRWFKEPSPFRCVVQPANPRLCVITGPNVCGKSLLRKILHAHHHDRDLFYMHLSQEHRCNGGFGRLMVYASEGDDSTGHNSVHTLLTAIKNCQSQEKPFGLMFDEPEIGCSEEVQMAIGTRIGQCVDTFPKLGSGVFVITHSREVVRSLLPFTPTHWRLSEDGMTLDQFVTREVLPMDLQALVDLGHDRWRAVEAMLKEKRKGANS